MTRKLQMPPVMEERDAASKVANMPGRDFFDVIMVIDIMSMIQ